MAGAAVPAVPPQNRTGGQLGRRPRGVAAAAVCAAIVGGVVLAADRGPTTADAPTNDLAVAEVLTAPTVDQDGIVFSVGLRNAGAEAVSVAEVTALADDGVDVEVLGASTCRHGCAGALPWADAESMMERSIEWSDGFRVPAEQDVLAGRADPLKVVLRVRPADASAERRLASECLFVRQLLVRVGAGTPRPLLNRLADFVVALDRRDAGMPGVRSGCPIDEWEPALTE